jgi:hypothetical protein
LTPIDPGRTIDSSSRRQTIGKLQDSAHTQGNYLCGAIVQVCVFYRAFHLPYVLPYVAMRSQIVDWFVYIPMAVAVIVIISAIRVVQKSGRVIWFVPTFVCGVLALAMGAFFLLRPNNDSWVRYGNRMISAS